MINDNFVLKTDKFSGPIEILLDMIESKKLNINKISLSSIVEDFISFIKGIEKYDPYRVSQFVHVASILLLIKSKSIISVISLSKEETVSIEELEMKLNIYKLIKKQTVENEEMFLEQSCFSLPTKKREVRFTPKGISKQDMEEQVGFLCNSINSFLNAKPVHTVEKTMTIGEVINSIQKRISELGQATFASLSSQKEKKEIIVSFLAILELVKDEILETNQESSFSDIRISKKI